MIQKWYGHQMYLLSTRATEFRGRENDEKYVSKVSKIVDSVWHFGELLDDDGRLGERDLTCY